VLLIICGRWCVPPLPMSRADAAGNITAFGSPATESYSYGPLYRLTAVKNASGMVVEGYIYNRSGDRLSKIGGALATGTYGYASGTHHVNAIGSTARTYDTNGNTTGSTVGGEVFGFGYNNRNRMTVVQRNQATVGTYGYSANGERLSKVATLPTSATTRFAYDEDSQLLGEYSTAKRDYVWLDNVPVVIVDTSGATSTISYVHADALGTPRAVTSTASATVWQWAIASNPFGEKDPTSTGGFALNLRFPGQYFDAKSGLDYNVNRDYEPATGRYIQADPMGLAAGTSLYGYVGSNPTIAIDPLGLVSMCRAVSTITGSVVGVQQDTHVAAF
jgi:RHS repeat-associated protein